MYPVNFFMSLTTVLLGLTYAENKHRNFLEDFDVESHRKSKVSSEFGYNVLNSDRVSNHFRQEHRDVNGVVRGSYGFKNPDGLFRLVQYIADNRGFRAHISSNEHGIGKQNPAGVSINRFDHQPLEAEERFRPPISDLRRQYSLQDELKTISADNFPNYATLSLAQNKKSNDNQYDRSVFHDGSNAYEYDPGRQEFYSSLRQTPVDKLMKIRFSTPDKIISNSPEIDRYKRLRHDHIWDSNPFVTKTAEHLNHNQIMNTFYRPLNVPSDIINRDKLELVSQTQKSNHENDFSNYPDYADSLYHRPLQQVHNSLPDCNSASSAVLCKPPLQFREAFQGNQNYENSHLFHDVDRIQAAKIAPSYSKDVFELTGHSHNMYPLHLVPKSYPLRSEIYKKFFSHLSGHSQSNREDKNCQKGTFTDETTEEYISPSESHRFPDSTDTNDLSWHNQNMHPLPESLSPEQTSTHYSEKQNELNSRLIRIIQSDESLEKLKHILLQSNYSSPKTVSKTESPKLSLLGVLILPSSVIKQLDYEQHEKSQSKYISENFHDKSLSENSFESDIPDVTKYLQDINKTLPTVDYDENLEYKSNASLNEDKHLENESKNVTLPTDFQEPFRNPVQKVDYNLSDTDFPAETVTSPKLYVYDEQTISDKEKNSNSNFSTDNWRKVLEDEISKEIRDSALRHDVPSLDALLDETMHHEQNKQSNKNPYSLNKHIGPLYDSTGKLIQPENVPIHIHRFNPPSGLTSLPWKYSIPRPAPPRSIVVPPKPPTLS